MKRLNRLPSSHTNLAAYSQDRQPAFSIFYYFTATPQNIFVSFVSEKSVRKISHRKTYPTYSKSIYDYWIVLYVFRFFSLTSFYHFIYPSQLIPQSLIFLQLFNGSCFILFFNMLPSHLHKFESLIKNNSFITRLLRFYSLIPSSKCFSFRKYYVAY